MNRKQRRAAAKQDPKEVTPEQALEVAVALHRKGSDVWLVHDGNPRGDPRAHGRPPVT